MNKDEKIKKLEKKVELLEARIQAYENIDRQNFEEAVKLYLDAQESYVRLLARARSEQAAYEKRAEYDPYASDSAARFASDDASCARSKAYGINKLATQLYGSRFFQSERVYNADREVVRNEH